MIAKCTWPVLLLAALASASIAQPTSTLKEARTGHDANVISPMRQKAKPPTPPKQSGLQIVSYPGPLGAMAGYLTKIPADGQKHPAIVWISGGDTAIGDFWTPQPPNNDQTAMAFREAGLIVFYPSVRGLNGNPGQIEGFYGELDDLVAATKWLKQQPGVDPDRVYLGGHSSGGTMVLLAAAYSGDWKGVISFGPVHDPRGYGPMLWGALPFNSGSNVDSDLRAPMKWLGSITMPTLVIEGDQRGNVGSLDLMRSANHNPAVHFALGRGCSHFSILRPASEKIAKALVGDGLGAMLKSEEFSIACQ